MTRRLSLLIATPSLFLCAPAALAQPAGPPQVDKSLLGAAEENAPPFYGWIRAENDTFATELQIALARRVGNVGLTGDLFVTPELAQVDFGPDIMTGPWSFLFMGGVGFDTSSQALANVDAQLYLTLDLDHVYAESWVIGTYNLPTPASPKVEYYMRNFALWKFGEHVAVGPQAEIKACLDQCMPGPQVTSLPVGAHVDLKLWDNTLGIFLAYDGKALVKDGVFGRVTYIRDF